jgi:hypothetical protein
MLWVLISLAIAFYVYLGVGGGDSALLTVSSYVSEYVGNSREVFVDPNRFEHLAGTVVLSNGWSVVPRFIYPDKPFEYGVVLLNSVLYPGAAGTGVTPGLLEWLAYYVDFGIFGVLVSGLLKGVIARYCFMNSRKGTIAPVHYLCLISLALFPVLAYASFFVIVGLMLLNTVIIAIVHAVCTGRHSARPIKVGLGKIRTRKCIISCG